MKVGGGGGRLGKVDSIVRRIHHHPSSSPPTSEQQSHHEPRQSPGSGSASPSWWATLVAGPLTGAALNPARAFGPAFVTGAWHGQAVYWIGPLARGGVAGAAWRWVLED